ncbi:GNAT family N-acetyltransferase [Aeoliella sp.]|uniref:GNAT family N-acetyltransferase n=1 Tax=Aeoliella sp. TaxID=2795800 RepID=UPI003CCBEE1B
MFPSFVPSGYRFWPFAVGNQKSKPMSITYIKRYRMEVDLTRQTLSPPRLPAGYRLRAWSRNLVETHAETKYLSFHGELDAAVFPSLGTPDGCQRLMQGISSGSGFVPEATWLIEFIDQQGRREPCATIQGMNLDYQFGSIQNVGVVPYHRGQGLGSALILAALIGFQQVGLARACLEVTVRNKNAVRLYQRLGFRRAKTIYKSVETAHA